jgi:hypothetical protein
MSWNMARILKRRGKREKEHCLTWNMVRNTEKGGK